MQSFHLLFFSEKATAMCGHIHGLFSSMSLDDGDLEHKSLMEFMDVLLKGVPDLTGTPKLH